MRYGNQVKNRFTWFPFGIHAVQRTPVGDVELLVDHLSGPEPGDTPAGRITLSPGEAAALAGELCIMIHGDGAEVAEP